MWSWSKKHANFYHNITRFYGPCQIFAKILLEMLHMIHVHTCDILSKVKTLEHWKGTQPYQGLELTVFWTEPKCWNKWDIVADRELVNLGMIYLKCVYLLDHDHFKHFKQNFDNHCTRIIKFCDVIDKFCILFGPGPKD